MSKINMFTLRISLARLGVPREVPGREEEAVRGRAVGKDRGGAALVPQSFSEPYLSLQSDRLCRAPGADAPRSPGSLQEGCKEHKSHVESVPVLITELWPHS